MNAGLAMIVLGLAAQTAPAAPLRVGVTLHPYYSWTKAITKNTPIEVRAVLPGDVDVGSYQPRPEDLKKLIDLDAIVINGLGHDDFIRDMIAASGNKKLVIINPNEGTPLIQSLSGGAPNSHTFISFTNAIQQTYAIQTELARLRPELAPVLEKNAAAYAKRLRAIKGKAAAALADADVTSAVTVHDGYSYLLQELGLEVAAVVEPAHGLVPSASELKSLVKILNARNLRIVLSEESFPAELSRVLEKEAAARVYVVSHVATGEFTEDKFEREMAANVETVVRAMAKKELSAER